MSRWTGGLASAPCRSITSFVSCQGSSCPRRQPSIDTACRALLHEFISVSVSRPLSTSCFACMASQGICSYEALSLTTCISHLPESIRYVNLHLQVNIRAVSSGKSRGAGCGPAAPRSLPTQARSSPSISPADETAANPGTPRRCLITNQTTAQAHPRKQSQKPSSHWKDRGRVLALLACRATSWFLSTRLLQSCKRMLTYQLTVRAASAA